MVSVKNEIYGLVRSDYFCSVESVFWKYFCVVTKYREDCEVLLQDELVKISSLELLDSNATQIT